MRKFIDIVSEASNKTSIPIGKVLASYTDEDGYKVSIVGGVPKNFTAPFKRPGLKPSGVLFIMSPNGEIVWTGYFMNWVEPEYGLTDEQWNNLSWKKRAELEVKQQATAYKKLSDQFEWAKSIGRVVKFPVTFTHPNNFLYEDVTDDTEIPKSKYPFFNQLQKKHYDKNIANKNKVLKREKERKRFEHEQEIETRHVAKSVIGYKPFKIPLIRFGKFKSVSRNFLPAAFRREMGNVTHEQGVSCFRSMGFKDGFLLMEHPGEPVYGLTDCFKIIPHIIIKPLIKYVYDGVPMDIFLIHGHCISFGKNNEWLSVGSDGELLLDTTKPYKMEQIGPEKIYIRDRNLIEWMKFYYPDFDKIKKKYDDEKLALGDDYTEDYTEDDESEDE